MEAFENYLARFANIADSQHRTYAAMMSAMDDAIGRTLAALRDQKLEEKTLVIFLNDNGGPTMPTTTINGSSNGPLRGSKRQTWEGGIRVAFAMSWKGHLDAGRVDDRPIIQLDVLPTALAAAGVATNASEFDGVNLLPFLTGTAKDAPHDALYWRLGGMMAIRKGDWKLVKTREGPLVDVDPSTLRDLSDAGLYNLSEDIGETRNRAAERPDKVKELSDLWQQWNRQLSKPLWGPRPRLWARWCYPLPGWVLEHRRTIEPKLNPQPNCCRRRPSPFATAWVPGRAKRSSSSPTSRCGRSDMRSITPRRRSVTKWCWWRSCPRRSNGEEPPAQIAYLMTTMDVVLCPTSKSLTHTDARRRASTAGVRVGTLPGVTEDIMVRCMNADYMRIAERTHRLCALMESTKVIRVEAPSGTQVTLPVAGRRPLASNGLFREKGAWGNLPTGEAYLAPLEGQSNGVIVVDGSMAGVGML